MYAIRMLHYKQFNILFFYHINKFNQGRLCHVCLLHNSLYLQPEL